MSRARDLLEVVAVAALAMGGTELDGSPIRLPSEHKPESIDDILRRARSRKSKAWWQPGLGGSPLGRPRIFTGPAGGNDG